MNEPCPASEELLAAASRSGSDPALVHAESCPRCRNELRRYREFLAGRAELAEDDRARVLSRLGDHVRELAGSAATPAPPASERREPGTIERWIRAFRGPWLRPALGVAALALALALLPLAMSRLRHGPMVLRGAPGPGAAFEVQSRGDGHGGFEAWWEPVPGADRYRVVLLDAELDELGTPMIVGGPRVHVPADSLPAAAAAGRALAIRVEALSGNAVRARSWVGTVRR